MAPFLEGEPAGCRLRKHWKWIGCIVIVSVLSFVFIAGFYFQPDAKAGDPRQNSREEKTVEFVKPPHKLKILVLGVDSRPQEGDPGRSDTTMVFLVDSKTLEITQLSIPRDTRVMIKGHGRDKINHAFAFGGVKLSKETVENFLGISIDYYAVVDIDKFPAIIDAVGGVTLNVDKRMQYVDSWDHYVIDLQPGVQRLDGRTALQYVRYRDDGGDIGRVPRQQNFVKALLKELNQASIVLKAPGIIRDTSAAIDTDMSAGMMLGMAMNFSRSLHVPMQTYTVPGLPIYIDEISYWIPDVIKTREMVAKMQGNPFESNLKLAPERQELQFVNNLKQEQR